MGLKLLNDIYQFRFLFFLRFILSFTFFIFFFFFLWFNSWSRRHVEMCGREDFWISLYPVPHMLSIIPRPFRTRRLNSWGEDFFMGIGRRFWKETQLLVTKLLSNEQLLKQFYPPQLSPNRISTYSWVLLAPSEIQNQLLKMHLIH